MTIIALEALTFGLNRLAHAANLYGERICLLTRNRDVYKFELEQDHNNLIDVIDVDTFDLKKVEQAISKITNVRGLLNLTDTWSIIATELAYRLGLPRQNIESIQFIRNKHLMRNRLYEAGLSRGRSVAIEPKLGISPQELSKINYPVIIKDCSGTGSANVWSAHNAQELEDILNKAATLSMKSNEVIIEPFFNGTLYSAESITWNGETRVYAITSRIMSYEPAFREEAMAVPVQFDRVLESKIHDFIKKVLASLDYKCGISHTEFILTEDNIEVVEVNPRAAGGQITESICQAYGVNILEAYIQMALGQRPNLLDLPLQVKQGVGSTLVYASSIGKFIGIEGLWRLEDHIGSPKFYPTAQIGKQIDHLQDQSACIGIIVANGQSSEHAMLNAISATGKLKILME